MRLKFYKQDKMNMKVIKKIAFSFLIICIFASCTNNKFTIEGTVKNGSGEKIYLENITASAVVKLDSVDLGKEGYFCFKRTRPQAPDFYRLRLKHQFINLSVDSTETLKVNSNMLNFAADYTVEGSSESEKIKELTFLQLATNEAYNLLQKKYNAKEISVDEYTVKAKEIIDGYKEKAIKYIISNPSSASAYFALFQQVNGLLIFDPYDRKDSKMFGAVANNWNLNYPNSPRTKHLVNLFKSALLTIRSEQNGLQPNEISSKQFFDFSLPSVQDKEIRLSEAGAGKVVLLDFTAYAMENSPQHNMVLMKAFQKYASKGFTIYQVSLDQDIHFWKNAAINIPWTSVIDPQSVYSETAKKYNVTNIPTGFLLNRNGEIVVRIDNYDDLDKQVGEQLK